MTSYRRTIWHDFDAATWLLFGALAALSAGVVSLYIWGDSLILELLAISFFCLMHVALLRRSLGMFLFYLPVLFNDIGMLMANAALASNRLYISEANYTSYDIGAFPLLVITLTAMFLPYAAVVWWYDRHVAPRSITSPWEPRLALMVATFPVVVSYVAFAWVGTPWLTGETRSAFWALGHVPQFFFTFGFHRLDITTILAGMLAFLVPGKKYLRIGVVLAFLIILSSILFGGRAGSVISTLEVFLLPYAFLHEKVRAKLIWRAILAGIVLVVVMLSVTLLSYAVAYRHGFDAGVQLTLARIVLQGQVWWNIYYTKTIAHIGVTGASFWNEWAQFISLKPHRTGLGSDLLLRLIAPPDVYRSFTMQDVRFAAGWPALGYYYFGPIVLQFVQVLLGVASAALALGLKREMLRAHYATTIILGILWSNYLFDVIGNAEWWELLNVRPVLLLIAALALKVAAPHLRELVWRFETGQLKGLDDSGMAHSAR